MAVYWYNSLTDMVAYAERQRDDVLRERITVQTDRGEEIYLGTDIELSHEGFTPPPIPEESETDISGYLMAQNTISFDVTFDPAELDRLNEWTAEGSRIQQQTLRQIYEDYLGNWHAARVEYRGTARQMGRTREARGVPDPPVWIDEAVGDGFATFHTYGGQTRRIATSPPQKHPAAEKAEELLLLCLNDRQTETYQEWGYFDVAGSEGGRYRIINWYRSYNVLDLSSRDPEGDYGDAFYDTYCALPMQGSRSFPIGDQLLAQKLMLETDEKRFLGTANFACDLFNEIERFGCIQQEGRLK